MIEPTPEQIKELASELGYREDELRLVLKVNRWFDENSYMFRLDTMSGLDICADLNRFVREIYREARDNNRNCNCITSPADASQDGIPSREEDGISEAD